MKDQEWKNGAGRLGHAYASRNSGGASLHAQRVKGAVKFKARLAWQWSVGKGSPYHDEPSVRVSGKVETETEARAAADAALPAVLRAFDALTGAR